MTAGRSIAAKSFCSRLQFRLLLLLALAAASMVAPTATALATEKIISFDAEIWIQKDGSLNVRETITVDAEGDRIKRGIYRDFPTTYTSERGVRFTTTFDVQSVRRDGQPENYFTEDRSNGVRLYIGNKEVLLRPGRYVYEITYRTNRQLGHFDDRDELYWNVTGNDWAFDIHRATAKVHLPEGARMIDHAAYTGAFGAKGQDFYFSPASETQAWFETTRHLAPGEGLTIAVAWPPGFVARPSATQQAYRDFLDHGVEYSGGAGFIILLIYYLFVWHKVGRDPKGGSIYPLYEPPHGISPAAARFVRQMGFDNKAFTSAIVNLAVKGYLTIRQNRAGSYVLRETGETVDFSPGERALTAKLFTGSKGEVTLKQSNHRKISNARNALKRSLGADYETTYFARNIWYWVPGLAISVLIILAMVLFSPEPVAAGFLGVWLTGWSFAVATLVWKLKAAWNAALVQGGVTTFVAAIFLSLFAAPFIVAWLFGAGMFTMSTSLGGALIILAVAGLNVLFYNLLKAPTLLGRQLLDQLDGFELFMTVAEKDRMNLLNPPERTPELFEKYLPYALALGVEQKWAEGFADVLGAIRDPQTGHTHAYSPHWYSGRDFDGNLNTMTSSLSDSLSSAISSAATAPGSSSGSSGGGSSGGGGGGGGGGGW